MVNYGELAFSDAAKMLQEEFNSRDRYEQMEKNGVSDGLTDNEILFINNQDHFYMASIGENGYPYIQHRGGPKGFLKVIDNLTLAFVDFSGNRQFVSVGNFATNSHVAVIMISYPHRARLKLYAEAKTVSLEEDPELFARIDPASYKHRPERMIILTVKAFDWNCPQHIIPRYTSEEVEQGMSAQYRHFAMVEEENKRLKSELENLKRS